MGKGKWKRGEQERGSRGKEGRRDDERVRKGEELRKQGRIEHLWKEGKGKRRGDVRKRERGESREGRKRRAGERGDEEETRGNRKEKEVTGGEGRAG